MAFFLAELFWVGVVPCAVAAVIVATQRFGLRPAIVWAASVGGAIIVGQFALAARNGWQTAVNSLIGPHEARDWLPWLALAAAGIGMLATYSPQPSRRWIAALACLFALAVPLRLLAGSVYVTSRWSTAEKLGVLALWSALLAAMWFLLAAGRANGQTRVRGGLLVAVAAGMAITITLSGSITTGELCGVVAAALAGTLLGEACFSTPGNALHNQPADVPSAAAGVLAIALGGLILLAYYYASLTALNAALLAVAVATAGGRLPTTWPRGPAAQATLRAALSIVPLAIAVVLALTAANADPYAM